MKTDQDLSTYATRTQPRMMEQKMRNLGVSATGKPDGGAASARPRSEGVDENGRKHIAWAQPGMTVRDAFALAAMQGLIASGWGNTHYAEEIIERSFELADAALVEREK